MREYPHPTGSPEWLECRRGAITGSRAKDVRRTDGLTAQQRTYVAALRAGKSEADAKAAAGYQKKPSAEAVERALAGESVMLFSDAAHAYAKELARERCGGREPEGREGLAQRIGHEEEQFAAIEYVARTGFEVEEAFFISTDDGKFGCTLDRWVKRRTGALELKTMVSSTVLFQAMVDEDIAAYRDQCIFALWLLTLPWIDLGLWCADLGYLHIIRIHRDEDEIAALEQDLIAFDALVSSYEKKLRARISPADTPPWSDPQTAAAVDAIAPQATPTTLAAIEEPAF